MEKYLNINTSAQMNEVVKEQLKFRGDHLSLYAAKRIEELEALLPSPPNERKEQ